MQLTINDGHIFYTQQGAGAPLILLHGNGESHQIFEPLAAVLSQSFTVYQLDSRNHGQSSHGLAISYELMRQDLQAFISALDLHEVNILGFSDGAIVATLLALATPARLNKLALLGLNLSPTDFKPAVYQEILAEFTADPSPLTKMMLTEPDLSVHDMASIHLPVLVVAGADDVCPPAFYTDVVAHLPQGELLALDGETHSSYIIDTPCLAPTLLAFFQ